jgi:hypothetical protein
MPKFKSEEDFYAYLEELGEGLVACEIQKGNASRFDLHDYESAYKWLDRRRAERKAEDDAVATLRHQQHLWVQVAIVGVALVAAIPGIGLLVGWLHTLTWLGGQPW